MCPFKWVSSVTLGWISVCPGCCYTANKRREDGMTAKYLFWLAGSIAAIWLALGCSGLPYNNGARPVEPPPAAEQPPTPAGR